MKAALILSIHSEPIEFVYEAFYSVFHQCQPLNIPIIIAADNFTEEYSMHIKALANHKNVSIENLNYNSLSKSLNSIAFNCTYDYIIRMDGDDISHPNRLKKQLNQIKMDKQIDVIGTNLIAFKNSPLREIIFSTDKVEAPYPASSGNRFWLVNHGTTIIKTKSLINAGGYDENLERAQDVDLWRRMYERGAKFRNVTDILYYYRRPS